VFEPFGRFKRVFIFGEVLRNKMMTLEQLIANTKFDHSRNVAQISRIIAIKAGYSADETAVIEQAGLLHDVGKSDVPFGLLNKPGALTPEEYSIVKKHTEDGYRQIMGTIQALTIAASVAKEHHERLDGSGYFHLSNGSISHYSRLIAVADVFDALVSRRAYKEAWDTERAVRYLADNEKYFDCTIVGCLVSVLDQVLEIYKN